MSSGREQEICRAHVGIYAVPLGVVEDIECLCAELNLHILLGFEDFEYRHIEVRAMRIVQTVPTRVTEG